MRRVMIATVTLLSVLISTASATSVLRMDTEELTRRADGEIAPVHVASGVPKEAHNGHLVCAPRRTTERGGFLSSFTALFG